ncbi:MAG: hypothetical protein ACRDNP_00550 [Gaiellaceae bacterium]
MRAVVLCAVGIVLTLPGAVHAVGEPQLIGTVGPGYSIELEDSAGNPVTSLAPGTYDIVVHDLSTLHNFHLTGPGVNRATEVADEGDVTWEDIVLQASSTYDFVCDPHSTTMKGSFTTGTPPQPPPPPGPPPPGPPPPPAPPPPPPPQARPLEVKGVKISVERRASKRFLVARARINRPAKARLALVRKGRTRASTRKNWAQGLNRIQVGLPRPLARGRWTAMLRVGTYRFKRDIRIG